MLTTVPKDVELARTRILQEIEGTLRTRPMGRPVYDPLQARNRLTVAPWSTAPEQNRLFENSEERWH